MSVQITHVPADQRSHLWVDAPLEIRLGERRLNATKWGLTGVSARILDVGMIDVGQSVSLTLTIPFQGFHIGCAVNAECEAIDVESDAVNFRFIDLGHRERELLKHFIEELVNGSMVSTKDTIQRIDLPLLPAIASKNAIAAIPGNRSHAKGALMTVVYFSLGFAVFGYLGSLLYSNIFWKQVSTAMISAPTDVVAAQFNGQIVWAAHKPGDAVKAGDVILTATDDQLEREIELADVSIREKQAREELLKKRRESELEKVRGFSTLVDLEQTQHALQVDALKDQYEIATRQYQRYEALVSKGLTTAVRAEDARRNMLEYKQRLEVLKSDMIAKKALAIKNQDKRVYAGKEVIGDVQSIDDDLSLISAQIRLSRLRHQAYLTQKDRLSVRAPFDGVIQQMPRPTGAKVRQGEVIAVFEQSGRRGITAFLQQEDLLSIGVGDRAIVSVPAVGESFAATVDVVLPIDYSKDGIQHFGGSNVQQAENARGASAMLHGIDRQMSESSKSLPVGTPVIVMFERKKTRELIESVQAGASRVASFFRSFVLNETDLATALEPSQTALSIEKF